MVAHASAALPTSAAAPSEAAPSRLPGLDGLRALAIVLVLAYHLFPGLAPGGFLGVDVFLVVSGYLITALLVAEYRASGRIRLGRFWARRARRLLPAIGVVVGVTAIAALALGGDVLVGIGWQLAGALTFSSNWWSIALGSSYLDQTSPELFRHFWSLAVEEQFYVLWPLIAITLLALPWRRLRIALVFLVAGASALSFAVVAGDPAADPSGASLAYFATSTHAFGLVFGAALAFAREPLSRATTTSRVSGRVADAAALVATLGLVGLAAFLSIDAAATYRGGLAAAAVLSGIVILAAAHPSGSAARILDSSAPRWLGERSYGLYLWHWPVLILLGAAFPAVDRLGPASWVLGALALALSIALAAVSYRFLEQPIRRRRLWPALRGQTGWSRPRRGVLAVASVLATLGLLAGTVAAVVRAPERSEAAELIAAGQAAIEAASATPLPSRAEETGSADSAEEVTMPTGDQIGGVGDSVMLAAAPQLQERFPGIVIDAAVSRQMRQAPEVLRAMGRRGDLRPIMIVHLGTNGSIESDTLREIRTILGPERQLILVSAQAPRDWIPGVNRAMVAFAADYREVTVADWRAAILPQLDLLARDQVHPGSAGGRVYTAEVERALLYLASLPALVDYDENPELWRPR